MGMIAAKGVNRGGLVERIRKCFDSRIDAPHKF